MTDPLLPWYEKELEFFRQMGAEFARSKPKIAARLSLDSVGTKDPHVERMVQAFAYLNARIRFKLDDDYPELTDSILSILYPHFLHPIPSVTTLELALDPSQGDLTSGYHLPKGTAIETEQVGDNPCRFQTTSPTTLYPLALSQVQLRSRPFAVPRCPKSSQAAGLLKLQLKPFAKEATLKNFSFDKLRFHIHLAQFQQAAALYELMFDNVISVVLASSEDEREPIILPPDCLKPGGFGHDDALLPLSGRTFPGYRLMTEFFAFPRKFLYFDVEIGKENLAKLGDKLEIYVLLANSDPDLEPLIKNDTVRLGCVPVVNLFEITADAITLNERETEYRIIADARREESCEIYSVDEISVGDESGNVRPFQPFYSIQHSGQRDGQAFWHASRKPGPTAGDFAAPPHGGTETYVSLVDTALSPLRLAQGTLYSKVTCFNRDLPVRLPFGGGRPAFDFPDGRGPISTIRCLTAPTQTRRPPLGRRNLWRVVSQLSLNHLSISGPDALPALKEMLQLYDVRDSADSRDMIEGIVRVSSRRAVQRVGGAFARGTEITIVMDDEKYTGSSAYLLASLLNQFLGMYSSINSFTRLVATTLKKQSREEFWEWAPRASDKTLV
ncbi:MAG: type VI secretion system baseplate subunit TssF [Planctomycetaceae bacterium]